MLSGLLTCANKQGGRRLRGRVALRPWVQANGATIEKFLAAEEYEAIAAE